MGIHPLELDDLALQADRRIRIELRPKGMMTATGTVAASNTAPATKSETVIRIACAFSVIIALACNLLLLLRLLFLGLALFTIALAAQHVRERVVALMAGVLID